MYISAGLIVEIGSVIAAVLAIWAVVYKLIKWVQEQQRQSEDISDIHQDLYLITSALLACLDGLEQLGADGKVKETHDDLTQHLRQRAHHQGGKS